jgi:hypothetical protein
MIDAPSTIDALQLKELHIDLNLKIKRKRWKSIILLKMQNNIVRMILNITFAYYKLLQLQCVQVQLNFQ